MFKKLLMVNLNNFIYVNSFKLKQLYNAKLLEFKLGFKQKNYTSREFLSKRKAKFYKLIKTVFEKAFKFEKAPLKFNTWQKLAYTIVVIGL